MSPAVGLFAALLVGCGGSVSPPPEAAGTQIEEVEEVEEAATAGSEEVAAEVAAQKEEVADEVAGQKDEHNETIGTATLESDGTIVLRLRAETGGAMGEAMLRYPPDDPRYAEIAAHVGELEVGEWVAVRPWD